MSLVERLGYQSVSNLQNSLSSDEIMEWMAYDMLQNPEMADKLAKEIKQQQIEHEGLESEANSIRELLMGLGG